MAMLADRERARGYDGGKWAAVPVTQGTPGAVQAPRDRPQDWRFAVLREKSCGIVPFREVDGEILYLVISSAVTKREHWEFPKGGVEEGEREIETALRELWEETGVKEVRVLPGYREPIRYIYRRPEGLVSKQVVYFIARVANPAVKLREVEAKDYRWANYEEARKLLRHANARALLERCHAFITGRPLPAAKRTQPQQQRAQGAGRPADLEGQRRRGGGRRRRREGESQRPGPEQQQQPQPVEAQAAGSAQPPPQREARPPAPEEAGQRPTQRRRRRRRRGGRRQERGGQQQRPAGSNGPPKEP